MENELFTLREIRKYFTKWSLFHVMAILVPILHRLIFFHNVAVHFVCLPKYNTIIAHVKFDYNIIILKFENFCFQMVVIVLIIIILVIVSCIVFSFYIVFFPVLNIFIFLLYLHNILYEYIWFFY